MTTTGYAGIIGKQSNNIRKALQGSAFIAEASAAALTSATVFDPTSGELINPIVTGYADLGWTTTDGVKISRSISTSEVQSWGSNQATRSDVTSDEETIVVEAQETNLVTVALWAGVHQSTISTTPSANGVVEIMKPLVAAGLNYRLAVFAVDEQSVGEFVIVEFYPKAQISSFGDQTIADGDAPVTYPLTFTALVDDTVGASKITWYGGAGWKASVDDTGFTLGS